uniref:Solute carrier family 22 member 21 n=1 Tax=Neogobius melanostomus TaxID=47308 RepID=A0A8C6TKF5_9GOBI
MPDIDFDKSMAFLGESQPYQWRLFILLSLVIVPIGFNGLSVVFFADTPAHRCRIPVEANLSAAWRNNSIPLERDQDSGAVAPSRCARYNLEALVGKERCSDGWEYDDSVYVSTIVTEWNLVCEDGWKTPLTSSINFGGVLAGSFISGQLSDRFGRKIVLFSAMTIHTAFYILQIFAPSWPVFAALHFVVGMSRVSTYISAFVLGMEVLSPHMRTAFSSLGACLFFAAGYMLMPLVAFLIRDWKSLLLGLSLPCCALLPLWWYIPESPRWLLSQGRIEEAELIIRNAAKMNKKQAPEIIFTSLQTYNICDLLRWGSLCWNSVNIAYFALSLNTSNLYGDPYSNCFLSALVEVPAYVLTWVMLRWWPRRLCLSATLILGGAVLLFIPFIPQKLAAIAVTLEMLGKFGAATAFTIVYAYTAELYPTVLRNTAVATCSMASRVGSIIAPYFIYLRSYWVSLPYVLMGTITALSGILSLLLPETHGLPLPETVEQMQPFPGAFHPRNFLSSDLCTNDKLCLRS